MARYKAKDPEAAAKFNQEALQRIAERKAEIESMTELVTAGRDQVSRHRVSRKELKAFLKNGLPPVETEPLFIPEWDEWQVVDVNDFKLSFGITKPIGPVIAVGGKYRGDLHTSPYRHSSESLIGSPVVVLCSFDDVPKSVKITLWTTAAFHVKSKGPLTFYKSTSHTEGALYHDPGFSTLMDSLKTKVEVALARTKEHFASEEGG